jgi:tellurite resistance protein TerC
MFFMTEGETDPNHNILVKAARKFFPVTARYHGEHFLVKAGSSASMEDELGIVTPDEDPVAASVKPGTWMLTPLALTLIVVETTDLIFAVDSIPAIFAITADPFIVFTSNVFAILGLRSLYFALAGILDKFKYLKPALALVLLVVGVKMLIASWLKEILGEYFNFYLLGVVVSILLAGVAASIFSTSRSAKRAKK